MSSASATAVPPRRTPLSVLFSLVVGGFVVLAVGVWLMRDAVSPPVAAAARPPGPTSLPSSAIERELRIEKDKVEGLSRELEAARRDVEAQTAWLADRDTLAREREALRKALQQMSAEVAENEEALIKERARNRELEQALLQSRAPVSQETAEAKRQPEPRTNEEPATPTTDTAADTSDVARLMTRAMELLEQGDIGSARAVLERASALGSAPALFALAETYDPDRLATWGTSGTQGDPAKAKDLYTKALAGGVTAAKGRLEALPKELAK
jgi:hypothetical protein